MVHVKDHFYTDNLKIAAIALNVLRRISIDPLAREEVSIHGVPSYSSSAPPPYIGHRM